MAINGTKVIDLDSHLVGDVGNWKHCIEEAWRDRLPRPLPTKPDERRKTLVGSRIMVGSEVTRQTGEKPEWHKAEDPGGRGPGAEPRQGRYRRGRALTQLAGAGPGVVPRGPGAGGGLLPRREQLHATVRRGVPGTPAMGRRHPLAGRRPGGQGTAPDGGHGQQGPQHEGGAGGGTPVLGSLLRSHLRRTGKPELADHRPRYQARVHGPGTVRRQLLLLAHGGACLRVHGVHDVVHLRRRAGTVPEAEPRVPRDRRLPDALVAGGAWTSTSRSCRTWCRGSR